MSIDAGGDRRSSPARRAELSLQSMILCAVCGMGARRRFSARGRRTALYENDVCSEQDSEVSPAPLAVLCGVRDACCEV